MLKIGDEIKYFWKHKCFAIGIPIMTFLSYITLLLNPTIGIDDTSFKLYYVDGVSPAMGRWCLYIINKIVPLNYNPHFVEAAGLAFFCLSVTLWCIVFFRVFGDKISIIAYTFFGMVLLSSPILSEVVVWYLQDGIYLGYGFTAMAVLFAMDTLHKGQTGKADFKAWAKHGGILSVIMLVVALGFYEAFMIVFLMAMVMVFMLVHALDKKNYSRKIGNWLVSLFGICVCSMMLRAVVVNAITKIYHLEEQAKVLETRGLGDIFGMLQGWFDGTKDISDFTFILKDFFVKYYLHAIVYTPIMILVLAVCVLGLWSILNTVRKKDGWILISALGIVLLPWLMPILEGWATYYRSSQYVPLLSAFAVLLVAWEMRNVKKQWVKAGAFLLALILLYRQGYEMNRWLYVDAMKYEHDKLIMNSIALEIMKSCDTDKPVCIIGTYDTPDSLISDIYVPDWSKKYKLINVLANAIDPDIFDKYNVEGKGYATAETPALSLINWGLYAYSMPGNELIKFWKMHGFNFYYDSDLQHQQEAMALMKNGPAWPENGSIVEMDNYIIVNLGSH